MPFSHELSSSDFYVIFCSLTGTGESGKSTFIKQMRIIHGNGYSEQDRMQFKTLVYQNIHSAVSSLLVAMNTLNIDYEDTSLGEECQELIQTEGEEIVLDNQQLIGRLWNDKAVQKCYERRREYHISDSAK